MLYTKFYRKLRTCCENPVRRKLRHYFALICPYKVNELAFPAHYRSTILSLFYTHPVIQEIEGCQLHFVKYVKYSIFCYGDRRGNQTGVQLLNKLTPT